MKQLHTIFYIFIAGFLFVSFVGLFRDKVVAEINRELPTEVPTVVIQEPTVTPSQTGKVETKTNSSSTTKCIVTISGKTYDVTSLKKTHSGGDIFVCNSDMTQTFFSQHNQNLLNNQMSKYLVK